MKSKLSESQIALLLPRNNFLIALLVILLGVGIGFALVRFNPVYVMIVILVMMAVIVLTFQIRLGLFILVASVFTFELSLGSVLPLNLTPSDVIVGALVTYTFVVFAANKTKPEFAPVFKLLAVFLLVMILSALKAPEIGTLIPRLIQFTEFGLAAFIIIHFFAGNIKPKSILIILVAGGAILSILIIYTILTVTRLTKDINAINTNSWEFVLDLIIPVAVAYSIMQPRKNLIIWLWPVTLLLLLGALATLSRGGYLGLIGGLGLVVALSGPARWIKVVPAGLAFITLIYLIIPEEVVTNLSNTNTLENYRVGQWEAAWQAFLDNPILGIGPGNLINVEVWGRYGSISQLDPHNFILRIAAETGLLGLICVLGIIFLTVRRMLINFRKMQNLNCDQAILNLGMLGGITAYSIHALFDVFWVRGSGLLFWIYIGLAYATAKTLSNYRESE